MHPHDPGDMTERVEKECPGLMEFSEVRDSFDYVYETEKMIRLQGKPYHSKRNFISRFVSRYDYEYIPLDQSNVEICLPMMEQWFAEHPGYFPHVQRAAGHDGADP